MNALERHSVGGQLSRGLGVGSIIALTTGGILVAAYLGTRAADIPFTDLSRDPAATLGGPWYTGILSTATIVVLLIGAGVALFAASLLDRSDAPSIRGLLMALGLLVALIGADDLFMLHESVFSLIGIGSIMTGAIYAVGLLAILARWRTVITRATDWIFLLLAAAGMGVSVLVDVILEERFFALPFAGALIEDPAKIVGMAFMTYYLVITARRALTDRPPGSLDQPRR